MAKLKWVLGGIGGVLLVVVVGGLLDILFQLPFLALFNWLFNR